MPRVEQYQSNQVSTQLTSQPRASAAVPAGAFGENITRGVVDIAQGALDMKGRIDTTAAEEALIQFEREKNQLLFAPESGYFNTLGRTAFDNAGPANESLAELKKRYGESLSQGARTLFDQAADRHITQAQLDISRHASKGLKSWEVGTLNAEVENTLESASLYWQDPAMLKIQNARGRQAVIDAADMEGLSAEAKNEKLQTYDSSFARAAIEAATSTSSVAGRQALDAMSSRLEGPDRLKIENMIAAKAKSEKTQADAQFAVVTATKLVGQYDDRQQIIDQINEIEDPDRRQDTMREAMSQFGFKKQAESEARAQSFEAAENHIAAGGTAETFKANDPEGWERLSPSQKKQVASGNAVVTDWNVYSDLMTLPRDKLGKIDPTDYYSKLAPEQRRSLISAVKAANGTGSTGDRVDNQTGRTRSAQTTATLEQIFGKKSKWNNETREKANGFYSLLDDEVTFREQQKGGKLTSQEFTDLLNGLTREVTIEKDWWPDATLTIKDVPAEDLPAVTEFLRRNRIPVTSDNIIKVYQQASQ